MTIEETQNIVTAISIAVQARVPTLSVGDPGDAKTDIIECIFRSFCKDQQTIIASLYDPPELGGWPSPRPATDTLPERVARLPVDWIIRLAQVPETELAGLFLDELSNAPPAVRAAAMRGVLSHTWGSTTIPALTTIAAMNPPEQAESGYALSAPLANRFFHIDWKLDTGWWIEQLVAGFPAPPDHWMPRLPADWRGQIAAMRGMIGAFGIRRPGAISVLPQESHLRSGPWPSKRSWTMASVLLGAAQSVGKGLTRDPQTGGMRPSDIASLIVRGCVGPDGAREFFTFTGELNLPNPEDLLNEPKSLVLPARGDLAYAVLYSVVSAVLNNNTNDRWHAAWKVFGAAAKLGRADIAASCTRIVGNSRPKDWDNQYPDAARDFIDILRAAGMYK